MLLILVESLYVLGPFVLHESVSQKVSRIPDSTHLFCAFCFQTWFVVSLPIKRENDRLHIISVIRIHSRLALWRSNHDMDRPLITLVGIGIAKNSNFASRLWNNCKQSPVPMSVLWRSCNAIQPATLRLKTLPVAFFLSPLLVINKHSCSYRFFKRAVGFGISYGIPSPKLT